MAIPTPPNIEMYQLTVLIAMMFTITLKIVGMYYDAKLKNPEIAFNPSYIVSGVTGLFLAYSAYMAYIPYGDTLINTFIGAAVSAIGGTLTVEYAGKAVAGKKSEPTPVTEPVAEPSTPPEI